MHVLGFLEPDYPRISHISEQTVYQSGLVLSSCLGRAVKPLFKAIPCTMCIRPMASYCINSCWCDWSIFRRTTHILLVLYFMSHAIDGRSSISINTINSKLACSSRMIVGYLYTRRNSSTTCSSLEKVIPLRKAEVTSSTHQLGKMALATITTLVKIPLQSDRAWRRKGNQRMHAGVEQKTNFSPCFHRL